MAIAFDAATDGSFGLAVTSYSWSHTCGASANFLEVFGFSDIDSGSDQLTGITYNTVAMGIQGTHVAVPNDRWTSLYTLANPGTGSALTVKMSASGTVDAMGGVSASYSGVGSVERSASNTAAAPSASITGTVTTTATGAWTSAGFKNDDGASTAGAGTTSRVSSTSGMAIMDSNGSVTPGSNTLTANESNNPNWDVIILSLAPSGSSAPLQPFTHTQFFVNDSIVQQ